tara:strand:- start:1625 stop:1996 length:372 start_codon:yes stop_codon:yes gene_type:complete
MNAAEIKHFYQFLKLINNRMNDQLKVDRKNYSEDWTEEVIVPKLIYDILPEEEKKNWSFCNLNEIYSAKDIKELFKVKPYELNKCFSKRFYKLSEYEIKEWEVISKLIKSNLPVNEVLIIYSQ